MFRFERLDVWQKSIDFAGMAYSITKGFPQSEQYGLTSQIRRAAVSISANIAEGASRSSDKDFSRFLEIAFGSLCETVSHLRIAREQNIISQQDYAKLYAAAEELSKMLSAFRNTLGDWKSVD
jgi:four helix bundle protein